MKLLKWLFLILVIVFVACTGYYFTVGHSFSSQKVLQLHRIEGNLSHKILNLPDDRRIKVTFPEMGLQADSVILINAHNGDILYEKNADESLPTASISKMMTEYLVLEAIKTEHKINWDTPVTISDYANYISNHPGFASVHLEKGKQYTVRDVFDAMAIRSANGAAIALAETVAGSEKEFVKKMNETAGEFGMDHTHFVDSTGLSNYDLGKYYSIGGPKDTNEMSAKDVAILAQHLIQKHPEILDVIDHHKITFQHHTYNNTNWMLSGFKKGVSFDGVDGLKTGYTDEAGYCFAGTVERGNIRLISVVLGAKTKLSRFTETEKLYKTAFSLF